MSSRRERSFTVPAILRRSLVASREPWHQPIIAPKPRRPSRRARRARQRRARRAVGPGASIARPRQSKNRSVLPPALLPGSSCRFLPSRERCARARRKVSSCARSPNVATASVQREGASACGHSSSHPGLAASARRRRSCATMASCHAERRVLRVVASCVLAPELRIRYGFMSHPPCFAGAINGLAPDREEHCYERMIHDHCLLAQEMPNATGC